MAGVCALRFGAGSRCRGRPTHRRYRSSPSSHRRTPADPGPGMPSLGRVRGSFRRGSPPPAPGLRRSRAASRRAVPRCPRRRTRCRPPRSGCAVCARHASTTDGAARSATSRMAPGPLSAATAARSTSLASRATTRTSGLAFLASSAISRFIASSSPTQITASARLKFGVGELGGGRDLDDVRAGGVQLLDDRRRQRVVTADDDVPCMFMTY